MSHTYISFIPTWEWSHFHIGFSMINYSSFVLISVPSWAFSCLVAGWLQFSLSKRGHCGWGQTAVSHCELSVSPQSCSSPSLPMHMAPGSPFLWAPTWNTTLTTINLRSAVLSLETRHAVPCRTVHIILNPKLHSATNISAIATQSLCISYYDFFTYVFLFCFAF